MIIVIILVILAIMMKESRSSQYLYIASGTMLVLVAVLALLPARPFREKQMQNEYEIIKYANDHFKPNGNKTIILLNTESPDPYNSLSQGRIVWKRFRFQQDVIELHNMLDTMHAEKLVYIWSNVLEVPGMREVMRMKYPVMESEFSGHRFAVLEMSQQGRLLSPTNNYINTYDSTSSGWSSNGVILDTTIRYSGRLSEKLVGEREFSSTLRYPIEEIPPSGIQVFASVFFKQHDDKSFHLVISVNRKGKTIEYYPVDLNQLKSNRDWNFGFASTRWLKSSLHKGDEVVVYCWNSGKNEVVYVDNFFVAIK